MWLDWVFANIFGIEEVLSAANANTYFDTINAALATDAFRPRALFERFNIEALATTEGPLDPLDHHRDPRQQLGWPRHHHLPPRSRARSRFRGLRRQCRSAGRAGARGCVELGGLSARAREPPRLFPRGRWRDRDRSRPPQRRHRRSRPRRCRTALRQSAVGRFHGGWGRAVPP